MKRAALVLMLLSMVLTTGCGLSRAGAGLRGFSDGYNASRASQVRCVSTRLGNVVQTSCN